jgi:hypothetical protein
MARVVEIEDGFWNIRGSFKLLGLVDLGTQASLVRLSSGGFVLLDCYTLEGEVEARVRSLTRGGDAIEAIVNLHPFHTLHVKSVAASFPHARLYGTSRHRAKMPELDWAPELTEGAAFAERFASDFDFMVPDGVELIPDDEKLHFGSVLAIHRATRTLHVDDTLNWMPLPWGGTLAFHPTLAKVLEPRAGAANEFRAWAERLAQRCEEVDHICTAHARLAPKSIEGPGAIAGRVRGALERVEKTLARHEARHGAAA